MLALLRIPLLHSILIVSALIAVSIPAVFVCIREATKLQRRRIVNDLSSIFEQGNIDPAAIPSFEFVKYKYGKNSKNPRKRNRRDYVLRQWLLGGFPLAIYLFVMNSLSLILILHAAFKIDFAGMIPLLGKDGKLPLFAWVVLSSHVGGLLFTLRAFKQAVNNFDMSPLSLVGATVNLAFGPAVALLLAFSVFKLPDLSGTISAETALFPLVMVTAFASGYYPEVVTRQLMDLSRLRNYKKIKNSVYNKFKAIPIEVLDGIDTEIRGRLGDYHLTSVQNLAAANPLMLFVETPYGVYEIMDWVAQAQLCSSVGPSALAKLWRLGIRTIFDLERVALDSRCHNDALIAQIGDILWKVKAPGVVCPGEVGAPPGPVRPPLAAVKANIRMRIANPHALRLRQIFNQVSYSLGDDAHRLSGVGRRRFRGSPPFARRPVRRRPCPRRAAGPLAAAAWAFFALWCALA